MFFLLTKKPDIDPSNDQQQDAALKIQTKYRQYNAKKVCKGAPFLQKEILPLFKEGRGAIFISVASWNIINSQYFTSFLPFYW